MASPSVSKLCGTPRRPAHHQSNLITAYVAILLLHLNLVVESWGNVGDAGSIGVFQGAAGRVGTGSIVFQALHRSSISTALLCVMRWTDKMR